MATTKQTIAIEIDWNARKANANAEKTNKIFLRYVDVLNKLDDLAKKAFPAELKLGAQRIKNARNIKKALEELGNVQSQSLRRVRDSAKELGRIDLKRQLDLKARIRLEKELAAIDRRASGTDTRERRRGERIGGRSGGGGRGLGDMAGFGQQFADATQIASFGEALRAVTPKFREFRSLLSSIGAGGDRGLRRQIAEVRQYRQALEQTGRTDIVTEGQIVQLRQLERQLSRSVKPPKELAKAFRLAERRSRSLGRRVKDLIKETKRLNRGVQSVAIGVRRFAAIMVGSEGPVDAFRKILRRTVGEAAENRRELEELGKISGDVMRQYNELTKAGKRFLVTIGEIVLQGGASTDVFEDMTDWLNNLSAALAKSDTQAGKFIRRAIAGIVRALGYMATSFLRVVQGVQAFIGVIGAAQNTLVEMALSVEKVRLEAEKTASYLFDLGSDRTQTALTALDELEQFETRFGASLTPTARSELEAHIAAQERLLELAQDQFQTDERGRDAIDERIRAIDGLLEAQERETQEGVENLIQILQGTENSIEGVDVLVQRLADSIENLGDIDIPEIFDADALNAANAALEDILKNLRNAGGAVGAFGGATGIGTGAALGGALGATPLSPLFDVEEKDLDKFWDSIKTRTGEQAQSFKDVMRSVQQDMAGVWTSGINDMATNLGKFLSGAEGGFEKFGEAVKGVVADSFGSIGKAFQQAAQKALAGHIAGGPLGMFGQFAAVGALFSLTAGLIGGIGLGGGGVASVAAGPDIISTLRPESGGPGGTIIVNQSIGAIFSRDESRRTVAQLVQEARTVGELAG